MSREGNFEFKNHSWPDIVDVFGAEEERFNHGKIVKRKPASHQKEKKIPNIHSDPNCYERWRP